MSRSDRVATLSQRQLRVGEIVRHALAEILARGDLHDPEIEAMTISISEVQMSPDLKLATCYLVPIGDADADLAAKALDKNRRFLRGAISKRVELKFSPELRFRVDTSFQTGSRIDDLLRSPNVRRDLGDRSDDS